MRKKTGIVTLLAVVVTMVLVIAANMWRSRQTVKGVEVRIDYCGADTLVMPDQVTSLVLQRLPEITSMRLRDVDLGKVAQAASASPWLTQCAAGTSIGGIVVVHALQRRPIVRVCSSSGEHYLDDKGGRVPVSPSLSADVIVASGNIPDKSVGERQVWVLARFLDGHPRLSPLFDQIYRDASGDLFLTPKLGNHVVEIGDTLDLEQKFINLMTLYTRGLPQVGWEKYSQISVKYRGQVVCTRRNK